MSKGMEVQQMVCKDERKRRMKKETGNKRLLLNAKFSATFHKERFPFLFNFSKILCSKNKEISLDYEILML
jgi:hypothetical protein